MADQRVIDGRVFNVRKLYRNVEFTDNEGKKVEKKLEAFSLVPALPPMKSDDDYANWLVEAVESGVFKWQQVVKWALAQIPIDAGSIAFPGVVGKNAKAKEVKFTPAEMIEAFAFRPQAISNVGPNPDAHSEEATKIYEGSVYAEMVRLYTDSKKQQMDYSNWNPEDHVVMPKDIA